MASSRLRFSAHGIPSILNRLRSEYPPLSTILEAIHRSYGYRGRGQVVKVGEVVHEGLSEFARAVQ